MPNENSEAGFVSVVVKLLPLYLVYVFLSGWTFFDYYFRFFGVNPRWLDLSFYDTVVKGFTILYSGGEWLWLVYAAALVLPFAFDGCLKDRHWAISKLLPAAILFVLTFAVYSISQKAGISQARVDKSDRSRLPSIIFTVHGQDYHGKLLMLKGGTYFIHKAAKLKEDATGGNLQVSIYRTEDLSNVTVTGYE
jgi:hypothetical protein